MHKLRAVTRSHHNPTTKETMGKHHPDRPPRPRISGPLLLKTRWSVDGHRKGNVVERHLTGKAVLFYNDSSKAFVPVRVIRQNQIRNVQHASPGALIAFEGHGKADVEPLEFHVLKCSLIRQATFLPGDEAYERPDGTWRLMGALDTSPQTVEEDKTTFVWR